MHILPSLDATRARARARRPPRPAGWHEQVHTAYVTLGGVVMLSPEQLRSFDEVGAVTLDALGDRHNPLIDGLEAMLDAHAAHAADGQNHRRMVPMETRMSTPAFLEWVSSEWLEKVACELLRTDRVQFFQSGSCGCAYPQARPADGSYGTTDEDAARWRRSTFSGHVDTWVSQDDWEATPRRTILLFWLWLNDVTVHRAPMMVCPGSHLPIAAANQRRGAPLLPHAGGRPYGSYALDTAGDGTGIPVFPDASVISDATPLLAKRGQVTALTTSMYLLRGKIMRKRHAILLYTDMVRVRYHTSSPNFDDQDGPPSSRARKWINIMFTPADVRVGINDKSTLHCVQVVASLRDALRQVCPHRAYIADPDSAFSSAPTEAYLAPGPRL